MVRPVRLTISGRADAERRSWQTTCLPILACELDVGSRDGPTPGPAGESGERVIGARGLYSAGIRIGRDHIASTVNTLVLAYTAAALPTLLLFSQSGLAIGEILTTETLAVEIVQTLVGSIGLVASVPLTTALASWVVTLSGRDEQPERVDRPRRRPVTAERPEDMFWGRQ